MTYNKTTWVNGDTITAEKLNNMEEGIYMASSKEFPTFFSGSVTTTLLYDDVYGSFLTREQVADNDFLILIVNENSYQLPKSVFPSGLVGYGEFDNNGKPIFINYPYAVIFYGGSCTFLTSGINTYEIEIKAEKDNSNFIIEVQWDESEQKYIMDKTFEEIETAYRNNKQLKAQLHTLSLDLRGVEQSMAGNKYIFTKMSPNVVYEDSITASIEFIAITISNYQITYATKTASLELQ